MRRALSDGIVTLRPPDERDLQAIERGINDPDVVRWIGPPPGTAREVLELNRARWLDLTGPTFAVCDGDACIGHVWVNVSGERGAIGYFLLPEARGRGLASRAVRLVADWALKDLRLATLEIVAEPANTASRRVAERSGFRSSGSRRSSTIDGRAIESLVHDYVPAVPDRTPAGGQDG
jgi:RimJ/RimL family protein N-acetyltransferase